MKLTDEEKTFNPLDEYRGDIPRTPVMHDLLYGFTRRNKMKIRVSETTQLQLDWLVAKCEGYTDLHKIAGRMPHEPQLGILPPRKEYGVMDLWELSYSTNWAQGGPIIERECISVRYIADSNGWYACQHFDSNGKFGDTLLSAAMRCYVASNLGDEVTIPNELME